VITVLAVQTGTPLGFFSPGKERLVLRFPALSPRPLRRSPGSTKRLPANPLRPAFLYRARLEAVRRQAAVDGQRTDPGHFAALLEGLRLRLDGALRFINRGVIFEVGRYAFALHQWPTAPDFDEDGEIKRAEAHLAGFGDRGTPLLVAAYGMPGSRRAGFARRSAPR